MREDTQTKIQRIVKQHAAFRTKITSHPALRRVQQTGTIIALEFATPEGTSYFNDLRDKLYYFFLERGILLRPLGNVIYILPPYCMTETQLEEVYLAIEESLQIISTSATPA